MDVAANLHITKKGKDEVEQRVYKLNIKKRSVLILLDKPQTIEQILHRTVFPEEEIIEEVQLLIRDGFIDIGSAGGPTPTAAAPKAEPSPVVMPAQAGSLHLDPEAMLSEAKFLLTDFCVDSFGTESQAFIDQIRACKNIQDLDSYLRNIQAATGKICPERQPILVKLVKDINETA